LIGSSDELDVLGWELSDISVSDFSLTGGAISIPILSSTITLFYLRHINFVMPPLFEKVPEALERDPSLEEALTFHRLTRARMTAEVIRWMESIRLEDPVAWAQLNMDPDVIRPLILKWDFVFSTGMTTDYPKRRNWTHWMALREFIQNSLAYDEPILIMENGVVKLVKIGDFVEKNLREGAAEGEVSGVYALSFVPNHRGNGWVLRWMPITKVYKHKYRGDMFKVTLETGRSIQVTGAHSLFKLYRKGGKNELHSVPISPEYSLHGTYGKLHVGDLVALPFTRIEPVVKGKIDLEELAKRRLGDLAFLKVKRIEPCKYDHEWVYDVSVPGAENFVAGTGCFIVHNSLDVEERVYGYKNMAIKIFHDEVGVHVVDRGPGITLEAFKLGGSDKGCEERGFFGEGLKVAAAHFAGSDVLVYVFNRQGQAFKMCLSPGTNLVVVVMGRARYPPAGTEVILHGATISPDLLTSTIFQEWMRSHPEARIISEKVFSSPQCGVPKPNFIVKGADNVDLLWVRDIFVNTITNITRKPAIFGYNLWWLSLEPNRVTVASQSEFASQAAKAYTPEAALSLLDQIVERAPAFARVKPGFFETDIVDWWYVSDDVKNAVGEWVKNRDLGVTTNERAIDWVTYMGVTPLLIKEQLSYLFARAPEAETKVAEKSFERLKLADATAVPEEALSIKELKHFGAGVAILTWVHRSAFWGKKLPEVLVAESLAEASGTQTGNKIYVTRASLGRLDVAFSTLYHEYCHHYGDLMYGEAADLTEGFQKALTDVSGLVAEAFRDSHLAQAYSRALSGGWKANAYMWKEDHYVSKTRLLDEIFDKVEKISGATPSWAVDWTWLYVKIESEAPVCVSVSITPGLKLDPKDFSVSRQSVNDVIPEDLPPSRELYKREAEKIADEMPKIERGVIFMYDPWADSYEVLRRISV